jgi:hypothetical protein
MHYFLMYDDCGGGYMPHITKLLDSVREHGKQFKIILFPKTDMDPEFVEKINRYCHWINRYCHWVEAVGIGYGSHISLIKLWKKW